MEACLRELCARWRLEPVGRPIETPSSLLQQVRHEGGPALLKCLGPDSDEHGAASVMAWFGGQGSVRLLRSNHRAQLIEWLDGPPLSSLVRDGRDSEATAILADVVGRLHAPRPGLPTGLIPLSERMAPVLERRNSGDPFDGDAAELAARLLETTGEERPLHGDIHHDNILHHTTRGWLAIDAKGLIGDRHYDLANALCNPVRYPEIVCDPARVTAQAEILADRLSLDLERLLSFALCHAWLAEIWCEDDGDDPTHWRRMARIIRELRESR
jgi:streptomycin 6-kinase